MAKLKRKFTWNEAEITTKYEYSNTVVDGDDPKEIKIDSTLFNEQEWYEVKPILKKCLAELKPAATKAISTTHSIEDCFMNRSSDVNTRKEVYDYIIKKLG
ncbi:MAG: hypothetical protein LBU75_14200 [Desulfovibrio sp.]|jgi:hypothetical protein|nr:hypothetical protein [Desulfovibrio sp.]